MINLLRSRRSIRNFTPQPVEIEKQRVLEEAALRSPTSKNGNPWEFIFIDDPACINQLSQCKPHGAAFLSQTPLAIVVVADENKGDVWVEDCSIASILLQLTAQSIGLGSCWVQIRNRQHESGQTAEQFVQQLLMLPKNLRVLSIIAVGHPAQTRSGKPSEELQFQKIHRNKFLPGKV